MRHSASVASSPRTLLNLLGKRSTPLLVPVLLVACGRASPGVVAPPEMGWVTPDARLYQDNAGAYPDSLRLVVRDAATFQQIWSQATGQQPSPPPLPAVDFEESMVLLVASGRMTAEDRIQVDSVGIREVLRADGRREDVMAVVVRTFEGCGQFDIDAYPMEIVRVREFDGPVEFVERRERTCPTRAQAGATIPSRSLGAPDRVAPAPPEVRGTT